MLWFDRDLTATRSAGAKDDWYVSRPRAMLWALHRRILAIPGVPDDLAQQARELARGLRRFRWRRSASCSCSTTSRCPQNWRNGHHIATHMPRSVLGWRGHHETMPLMIWRLPHPVRGIVVFLIIFVAGSSLGGFGMGLPELAVLAPVSGWRRSGGRNPNDRRQPPRPCRESLPECIARSCRWSQWVSATLPDLRRL